MISEEHSGFETWSEPESDDESYWLFDLPEGASERFEEKQRALRRDLQGEHDDSPATSEDARPTKEGPRVAEGRRLRGIGGKPGGPPADQEGAPQPVFERQKDDIPSEQAPVEAVSLEESGSTVRPDGDHEPVAASPNDGNMLNSTSEPAAGISETGDIKVAATSEPDPWAQFLADEPVEREFPKADTPAVEDKTVQVKRLIRAWLNDDATKVGCGPGINLRGKAVARRAKALQKGGFDACHADTQLVLRLPALLAYAGRENSGLTEKGVVKSLYALGYERKRTRGVRFWTGPMISDEKVQRAA